MITICIADSNGKELEVFELEVSDVLPYITLIKEFGYLSNDNSDEYVFDSAKMLSGKYLALDVK